MPLRPLRDFGAEKAVEKTLAKLQYHIECDDERDLETICFL